MEWMGGKIWQRPPLHARRSIVTERRYPLEYFLREQVEIMGC